MAADERPDRDAAEERRGIDARADVRVDGLALGRIGMQWVVVVGQPAEGQAVVVEELEDPLRLALVEAILDAQMAGRERAVAELRPGGELQRLVAVRTGPGGDVLERALRHAGREEAELHRGASTAAGTSTQRCS